MPPLLPPHMLHVTLVSMNVNARVSEYRRRMRERGFRPVQIWVPDVRVQGFDAEAGRQASLVAGSASAADEQAFIEAVSVDWDEQ